MCEHVDAMMVPLCFFPFSPLADGLTSGDIFGLIITLCIVAVIAAVIFLLKCRKYPFHQLFHTLARKIYSDISINSFIYVSIL